MEKGLLCTTNPDAKTVFGTRKVDFGICIEYGIPVSETQKETKGELIVT